MWFSEMVCGWNAKGRKAVLGLRWCGLPFCHFRRVAEMFLAIFGSLRVNKEKKIKV